MGFIEEIQNYLAPILSFDEDRAWFESVDQEVKDLVLDLIRKDQLGDRGVDGDNVSLGEYAPMTIEERTGRGLQVDHVDFNFTGWFWTTFKVIVDLHGFKVLTDAERYRELVQELRFSETFTELTLENEQKVFELIRIKFVERFYEAL